MPSSTVENYLKQIYLEQQAAPELLVPMGKLAMLMGVVPGTATSMVKALADSGLVNYEPRSGARLTRGGEQLALHVLRRHRLLELFLVRVMDQNPAFLQFVERCGLTPGTMVTVESRDESAAAVTVKPEKKTAVTL